MYVCICNAVTESQIREAVASGTMTLRDLRETLGVAAQCGRCAGSAHSVLRDSKACSGDCATCASKTYGSS